jgi:condensin-2 complex subunit H2
MSDDREEFLGCSAGNGRGAAGHTYMVQPGRDLQTNWEVNLAKKLETYLLKICSGEVSSSEEDQVLHSVNFAEGGCIKLWREKIYYFGKKFSERLLFVSSAMRV